MQSIAILGRQPALGLAELESLFGAEKIHPLHGGGALLDISAGAVPFARLGGVIKLGTVLTILDTTDWFEIEKFLLPACKEHSQYVPEGKLTIGLSVYGLRVSTKMLERTSLSIKKTIKTTGRPVRIVPNKTLEISTPQILHNKLTHENGWELVFYRDGSKTIVARTNFVQDIESYTARDQARPMRDSRVGMLPPKLAQIIINLASSNTSPETVLDPFCGTGVVLQEASLMGMNAYGTDIEPRMVDYSIANLKWIREKWRIDNYVRIEVGDATNHQWKFEEGTVVACEGYLGLPFAHLPSDKQLQESVQASNTVMKAFLKNLSTQAGSGLRAAFAMPAWHVNKKIIHLPCLAQIEAFGWQRVNFKHVNFDDLIYHREDQIVGRELVVLEKI